MKSKTLATLVLAAVTSVNFGCASAKPFPAQNKSFHCELTDDIKKKALHYLAQLTADPVVATMGILIPAEDIDESSARCLDKALRAFGINSYGAEKWGLLRYEDDYVAIQVLY